jgi:excisionase family DNA binding protein
MIENEYVTLTEAAKLIGISRSMLHYLIHDREITVLRLGPKAQVVRRIDAERLKEKRAAR